MPYEILEQKVKKLPKEAFFKVLQYVDDMFKIYRIEDSDSIKNREDIAKSLFGVLDSSITLESSKEERLSKI